MRKVLFYEGEHYYLSNFSSFQVKWKGILYTTSEHAYQCAKFKKGGKVWKKILSSTSAHESKKIAQAHVEEKIANWTEHKLDVMEDIVRKKFEQHEYIQRKLAETENCQLIEDSPVDSFWGRGPNWKGQNNLGKIWMKIRSEIS